MRVKYMLLYIGIFFFENSFCQYIPVFKFTTKEGLPHSVVFRIMQDNKGFLWFSTDNGISCYDGSTFKNYNTKHGLHHNTVLSISESENNEKWVTTNGGGLSILKNETFYSPFNKTVQGGHIYFLQFAGNKMWCTDHNGVLYLISRNRADTTIKRFSSGLKFIKFFKAIDSQVYIIGYKGIYKINDTIITPYLPEAINQKVCAVEYNYRDSTLIVALNNKVLFVKNNRIQGTIPISIQHEIADILLDKQGKLWVSGPGKIYLIDGKNITDLTGRLQLEKTLINDLFEDRDGNIWIGTYGYGVLCVSTLKILNYKATQEAIANNVISLISVGDSIYSGSFGAVACITSEKVKAVPFKYMSTVDYLYFIKNIDGCLYIGTPRGILLKNLKTGDEKKLLDSGVISLCQNIDGTIWAGSYNSCKILTKAKTVLASTIKLPQHRYNAIAHDNSGVMYFGTDAGLYILKNNFLKYISVSSSPLSNNINCIIMDSKERIWLATNSGVFIFDEEKETIKPVFEDILTGLKCTSLQEDGLGNIWVGSFNGVYKLSDKKTYSYTIASGLVSNEVLSLTIDGKNRLWVGTVNGISCISTTETWQDKPISGFYITQVIAGQNKVFYFPGSLNLRYADANIKISFVGVDYPIGDKIEYQYTIENLIKDWRYTASTSLELPSLPTGSYIFKIRARKNNGEWSKTTSLPIYIQAPYWQQWWFKFSGSICLLLLLGVLVLKYVKYRERVHKEKASVESQMIILKQQALRAMINPHFVFNCLNNILGYIHKNERDIAKSYLVQFSRFFRMTLEHSKHEYIKLNDEIDRLKLYLNMEQLRFGEKMQYNIYYNVITQKEIWIPNMLIQPFIENAIVHGITPKETAGSVDIYFNISNEKSIIIIIEDDGPGFTTEENIFSGGKDKTSLGMNLSVERLKLLQTITGQKHTIIFRNREPHPGARIEIIIPVVYTKIQYTNDKFSIV